MTRESTDPAPAIAPNSKAIVTRMSFTAPPKEVWKGLMYYEQIAEPPPLYLRLLLPRPIRTVGPKSEIGDESLCLYEGGSLSKRVTAIDPSQYLGFDVVAQDLSVGGGIRLSGGGYSLREIPGGCTEVALETRYASSHRPRWLWRPVEVAVCHLFHRHILGAIRRKVAAQHLGIPAPSRERPGPSVSGA